MTDKNPLALSWDQRYSSETYAYGKNANAFFAAQLEHMNPGRLLLPGEGEGRNAVYAAGLGWAVEAFDQSRVGQSKALALASEFDVEFTYKACRMEDFDFLQNHYDLVALLFFHTDMVNRKYLHQKAIQTLKPGGTLLLEAFHKNQLSKNTGDQSLQLCFLMKTPSQPIFFPWKPTCLRNTKFCSMKAPFTRGKLK